MIKEVEVSYTLPDPSDLKYLKAASAVKADFIVTGNHTDFLEKLYDSIKVLSPRDFMDLLAK